MRMIDGDRLKDSFLRICTGGGRLGEISQEIIKWAVSMVDYMPTENRWIPCSERLPERHQKVLITIYGTDVIRMKQGESFEDAFARTRKNVRVSVGCRREERWYGADGCPMIVEPIAWMPMPGPFVEDKNE